MVRLRPNAGYLGLLMFAALLVVLGITVGGVGGAMAIAGGVVLLAGFGGPMVVSTVFRVPVVAVDATGIRLPLMGVRLAWGEIVGLRAAVSPSNRPVLLLFPADPEAAIRAMRPWVRSGGRNNMARYGAPIVIPQQSMTHTVSEVQAAIAPWLPPRERPAA